jgi:hypothetical protein
VMAYRGSKVVMPPRNPKKAIYFCSFCGYKTYNPRDIKVPLVDGSGICIGCEQIRSTYDGGQVFTKSATVLDLLLRINGVSMRTVPDTGAHINALHSKTLARWSISGDNSGQEAIMTARGGCSSFILQGHFALSTTGTSWSCTTLLCRIG